MPENRYHLVHSTQEDKLLWKKRVDVGFLVAVVFIMAAAFTARGASVTGDEVVEQAAVSVPAPVAVTEPMEPYIEGEDPFEAEKIELALVEQGYFRDDVPLSYTEQDYLHTACEEAQIPYALALAVIQKETQFQNIVGNAGASEGYMQVQRRWHWDRMERLGVVDLMDPFSNFRTGCDYLADLLGEYPVEEALTAYNSGSPGHNEYSKKVMANYEKWKELVGDEVSGCKG